MFPRVIARLLNRGLTLVIVTFSLTLTFISVFRHLQREKPYHVTSGEMRPVRFLHAPELLPLPSFLKFTGYFNNLTLPSGKLLPVTVSLSEAQITKDVNMMYWQPERDISVKPKVIVMAHFPSSYALRPGSEVFARCPKYTSCRYAVTQNPDVSADLVIIYSQSIHLWNMSLYQRPPGQIWAFFCMQDPVKVRSLVLEQEWRLQFNWTITYLGDSDVSLRFGRVVKLHSNLSHGVSSRLEVEETESFERALRKRREMMGTLSSTYTPNTHPNTTLSDSEYSQMLDQLIDNKTKLLAVLLNNCSDKAQSLKYIKLMQKIISSEVHVYGKCGSFKCPNSTEECYKSLERDYFFLFSFESVLCEDYVSEVYHILSNYYIVPVVRGGVNYAKFTPPKSVIDTSLFHSLYDLSRYLDYLEWNPKEYKKYFSWRKDFVVVEPQPFPWCRICAMLHEVNEGKRRHQAYVNVHKWWRGGRCFEPKDINVKTQF